MNPLVKNAADRDQVAAADSKVRYGRKQELEDLRIILETMAGRKFIWRLLTKAKVFESVWEPSAKIHYNAGQQDFGHYILAEVTEAKPEAILQMMNESKKENETNA